MITMQQIDTQTCLVALIFSVHTDFFYQKVGYFRMLTPKYSYPYRYIDCKISLGTDFFSQNHTDF